MSGVSWARSQTLTGTAVYVLLLEVPSTGSRSTAVVYPTDQGTRVARYSGFAESCQCH